MKLDCNELAPCPSFLSSAGVRADLANALPSVISIEAEGARSIVRRFATEWKAWAPPLALLTTSTPLGSAQNDSAIYGTSACGGAHDFQVGISFI